MFRCRLLPDRWGSVHTMASETWHPRRNFWELIVLLLLKIQLSTTQVQLVPHLTQCLIMLTIRVTSLGLFMVLTSALIARMKITATASSNHTSGIMPRALKRTLARFARMWASRCPTSNLTWENTLEKNLSSANYATNSSQCITLFTITTTHTIIIHKHFHVVIALKNNHLVILYYTLDDFTLLHVYQEIYFSIIIEQPFLILLRRILTGVLLLAGASFVQSTRTKGV